MGIRSKVEEGFHVSALPCGVVSDTKLFVMLSNAMDRIRSVPMGPSIEHPPAKPLRAAQTSNCRHPCGTRGAERFARGPSLRSGGQWCVWDNSAWSDHSA